MFDRRMFLSGAALMGAGTKSSPSAVAPEGRDASVGDEASELKEIGAQLRQYRETMLTMLSAEVEGVREQQRLFVKSSGKYPDYMDVGLAVWERIYDWHVRWQQPLQITRQPDGLYAMAFMMTTLLLRPNMAPTYIGPGFDNR